MIPALGGPVTLCVAAWGIVMIRLGLDPFSDGGEFEAVLAGKAFEGNWLLEHMNNRDRDANDPLRSITETYTW